MRGTVCVLMGLANLPAIASVLLDEGRPADTPVAVIRHGTTARQEVVRAPLGGIVDVRAAREEYAARGGTRR